MVYYSWELQDFRVANEHFPEVPISESLIMTSSESQTKSESPLHLWYKHPVWTKNDEIDF